MTKEIDLSALAFALLIDAAPGLTEQAVNAAYRAATRNANMRDDIEHPPYGDLIHAAHSDMVSSRDEIEWADYEESALVTALGQPVEGKEIVRPIGKVSTGAMYAAVARFVSFAGRLPHLGSWEDRQAVWNLMPGARSLDTPVTDCSGAYATRMGRAA